MIRSPPPRLKVRQFAAHILLNFAVYPGIVNPRGMATGIVVGLGDDRGMGDFVDAGHFNFPFRSAISAANTAAARAFPSGSSSDAG
jgi:hypothetical protein